MKLRFLALTLLTLFTLTACATAKAPTAQAARPGHHRLGQTLKSLGLSQSQTQQIRQILAKFRTDAKAVKQSTATRQEKASRIKALRADARKAMLSVLTPEQRDKAIKAKLVGQLRGKAKHKRAHGMRIMKQLNLTDAQKAQIKPIVKSSREAAKAVRRDNTLTPEAKRERLMQIRQDRLARIKSLLTPDQLNKLEALKAQRTKLKATRSK